MPSTISHILSLQLAMLMMAYSLIVPLFLLIQHPPAIKKTLSLVPHPSTFLQALHQHTTDDNNRWLSEQASGNAREARAASKMIRLNEWASSSHSSCQYHLFKLGKLGITGGKRRVHF